MAVEELVREAAVCSVAAVVVESREILVEAGSLEVAESPAVVAGRVGDYIAASAEVVEQEMQAELVEVRRRFGRTLQSLVAVVAQLAVVERRVGQQAEVEAV